MKTLISAIGLSFLLFGFRQLKSGDGGPCEIMKDGTFTTPRIGNTIEIRDSLHTEYSKDRSRMIRSRLTWTSECSYHLKVLEAIHYDGFAARGDTMNVRILSVKGKEIIFQATFNGMTLQDTLVAVSAGPI